MPGPKSEVELGRAKSAGRSGATAVTVGVTVGGGALHRPAVPQLVVPCGTLHSAKPVCDVAGWETGRPSSFPATWPDISPMPGSQACPLARSAATQKATAATGWRGVNRNRSAAMKRIVLSYSSSCLEHRGWLP